MFVDEVVAAAVEDAGQPAPRVVGVGGVGLLCVTGDVAVGILNCNRSENFHHVALLVQRVEVVSELRAVVLGILDGKRTTQRVVGENHDLSGGALADLLINDLTVQGQILMQRAVDVLRRANPVGIVGVFARLAARRDLCELPPVLPR